VRFDASESYTTPTLGYFNDDDVPDVFGVFLEGTFPEYQRASYFVVDGSTGDILWQQAHGHFAQAGDVAVDLNGDGLDEVLFLSNDWNADDDAQQQLHLLDMQRGRARRWGDPLGAKLAAAPWLSDIDADGCLDLFVPRRALENDTSTARLTRYRLPAVAPDVVRWGGYFGTQLDSVVPQR
jgi:hypothetical protein